MRDEEARPPLPDPDTMTVAEMDREVERCRAGAARPVAARGEGGLAHLPSHRPLRRRGSGRCGGVEGAAETVLVHCRFAPHPTHTPTCEDVPR